MSTNESAMPQAGALGAQAFHQRELDAGRFLIQRCGDCSRHVYYPRESCPHCGGMALEWKAPSGLGTVHAVTTVRRKPADGGDLDVSLIELDEGVRLMSRIENLAPAAVRIGQRVRARVQLKDGRGLVLFDAVEGAAR
ncbi:Zn-ribbon domain-containing OB-fold protein [Variovorax sp. Root434]|uniref:Zn-ribbon domain-containing OB-fold protein n=1 Tax=Variovorax sp. Root434 TaxID=1736536 RepID=UPI0006F599BD|nr:OB-fold domain-containing protein [Variovorax sp. Root434]KQX35430.1 DNA-binding protein [Variovorax sp. Root434]